MSSNRPPKTSTPPAGSKPPLATSSHPPRVSRPPSVFEPGKMPEPPPSKPPVVNAPASNAPASNVSVPPRTKTSMPPGAASGSSNAASKPPASVPPGSKPPRASKPSPTPSVQPEAAKTATPSMPPAVSGAARSNIFDAPSEPGLNVSDLTNPAAPLASPAGAPNVLMELTRSLAALHASEEATTPSADIDLLLASSKGVAVAQGTKPDPAAPAPEVGAPAIEAPQGPSPTEHTATRAGSTPPVAATDVHPQPVVQAARLTPTQPQASIAAVPATQPPAAQPPATQPPAAQPPAAQPPAAQPPATQPPAVVMDPRAIQIPAPSVQASYAVPHPVGFAPAAAAGFGTDAATPAPLGKPKVLAPTLVIYGSAFWAYLVLGELVIRLDFPERVAFAALLAIFVRHCYSATERATYKGAFGRFVPGVLAAVLWVLTLLLSAMVLGTSSRSSVAAVTLLLWFFAIAVYSIGRVMSDGPPPTEPKLTWRSGKRWWKLAAWIVSIGFTAVALLSAFDAA